MAEQLKPFDPSAEQFFHTGRFGVQLEIPKNSSLKIVDVEKILAISSWDGDINSLIDDYEGGRSVLVKRSAVTQMPKGVTSKGLQISGVCYNPPLSVDNSGIQGQGKKSEPPSLDNYCDILDAAVNTTGVKNARFVKETPKYRPLGSYEEREWRMKIQNTQQANRMDLGFSVPNVEAFGRYLDLTHEGGNLGFIVFSIPDVQLQRFQSQSFQHMLDNPRENKLFYFWNIASQLGSAARDIHANGVAHRQLHLGNFYHLEHQDSLYVMDWSTMVPLTGSRTERAMFRSIDLIIPLRGFEKYARTYMDLLDKDTKEVAMEIFFARQLNAYGNIGNDKALELYIHHERGDEMKIADHLRKLGDIARKPRRN